MSRKIKYSKELKLKIVNDYIAGIPLKEIINKYHLSKLSNKVNLWAHQYKAHGPIAFDSTTNNKSYSKEFKLQVINEYLENNTSIRQLAINYKIQSPEIVRRWIIKYNQGEKILDYEPKRGIYTMRSKKTTINERLNIVNYVINNNYDYKGAAFKYGIRYATIYKWVIKYQKFGIKGLEDNRGRPKTTSLIKRQSLEIERLRKEIQFYKESIKTLKKKRKIT